MSKISLAIKKNIRDFTEAHKTALARLAPYAGGDVQLVEPDWNALNDKVDSSYKDRVGEVVAWMIEGFASRLEYLFREDEAFNAALSRVWTSKKLSIRLGTFKVHDSMYHQVSLVDGGIVITAHAENPAANTELIGQNIVQDLKLSSESGVPYPLQKNIEKYQPQIDEALKSIAETTGVTGVTIVNNDYVRLNGIAPSKDEYLNRTCEVTFWFLDGLKGNLSRLVQDDLAK